jgi:ubiquinone/menaquinone biosynthesis C-methylase UbiE
VRLIGVDMSPGELAAARARLGDGRAELLCERAQALSLPDASVDHVLCHMALMLMAPLDAVLRELRRVSKPGGVLAAMLPGEPKPGDATERFGRELQAVLHGAAEQLSIGDPRVDAPWTLRRVLEQTGYTLVAVEPVPLRLDATPAELWRVFEASYTVDLLEPEARQRLEPAFLGAVQDLVRPDGTVPCSMNLQRITARAVPRPG